MNYDKGVLAEILEPIMGKGLIPADLETWKVRERGRVLFRRVQKFIVNSSSHEDRFS